MASHEEQNGANFSFIAPSSEELWPANLVKCMCLVKVVTIADHKSFKHSELLTGRCYEAEICTILFLLRCPFLW